MNIAKNRAKLIAALRGKMPPRFIWDFGTVYRESDCGTVGCALGLSMDLGIIDLGRCSELSRALAIPGELGRGIFVPVQRLGYSGIVVGYGCRYGDVTPQMVADKLEGAFAKYPITEGK